MKFFIDTANVDEVKDLASTGLIDGATTNPTLIHRSGRKIEEVIIEICELISGPVSAEVTASDVEGIIKEGRHLATLASNVVVKLPLTPDGLKACRILTLEGTPVNVTLCFSSAQALLAAKAGATFISPFVGRFDDIGERGMSLIEDIVQIYRNYPDLKTQVLAASIRSPLHVIEAALAGADVVTVPPKVFHQLYSHHLTEKGIDAFAEDWEKTGQNILKS